MNAITMPISLATLADSINANIREAEGAARSAMQKALIAGQQLNEAKEQVPHGQWKTWLAENVQAAERTAQAYMKLAREVPLLSDEEAQRVADLPLREAMKAITTGPAQQRLAQPTVRVRKPEDRERIRRAFLTANRKIREVVKMTGMGSTMRPREIASARRALEQALEQLNELERDHQDVAV